MPAQFFTDASENYSVSSPGDRLLLLLGGDDILTIDGGTTTTALMGEGDDLVRLESGLATIYGESGRDRFEVWADNAVVNGGGDNDTLSIRGGSGQTLNGDAGDDRFNIFLNTTGVLLDGGIGNDYFTGHRRAIDGNLFGGAGNDFFVDFTSAVTLTGGAGNDIYRVHPTYPGLTIVESAGEGVDAIQVSRGFSYTIPDFVENLAVGSYSGSTIATATLTGNALGNAIIGWGNSETFFGLDGDDRLIGKGGNDVMDGGDGDDLLDGGTGADTLDGGAGNDTLNGRAGDDAMTGGAGDDIYYLDSLSDSVVENVGEGTDAVRVTVSGYSLASGIETGQVWSSVGLQLFGNALDNLLIGGSGDDNLGDAAGGNDTLKGGGGNDLLGGGPGDDIMYGNDGFDALYGDAGDDRLLGGNEDDTLFGEGGNDTLLGGEGNDTLVGSDGDDVLTGDDGDDALSGNDGGDTMTGGAGSDTFGIYSVNNSPVGNPDQITDFAPDHLGTADIIDLSQIDANTNAGFDQAFATSNGPAANSLWYTYTTNQDGSFEIIWYGDVNGDTTPELELHVHQTGSFNFGLDIIL